jgi:REP element-mobilizing transposase RayT
MVLSGVGVIADILWHEITNHAENIELGAFVVMPNHVHGIIIINGHHEYGQNVSPVETTHAEIDVETTHAEIDVETTHAEIDVETTHAEIDVETTHALSLHPVKPVHQTIGQKRFQNQGRNTISSVVGSYKSAVTKHAHRLGLSFAWQSRFYDHIIRDDRAYRAISEYIINNPVKWDKDKFKSSE